MNAVMQASRFSLIVALGVLTGCVTPPGDYRPPEGVAVLISRPMRLLAKFSTPFVWLLSATSNGVMKALRIEPGEGSHVSEEEVRYLLREGTEAGLFEPAEQAIVDRANSALAEIDQQRQVLYKASSEQEQRCLNKFISAPCLEDLRQSHAAASRDLDLAAEALKEQSREAQAKARARARGVQRAP